MLKTAEFMPFVVFIASPKLESLKEINKSRVGSKKFTVRMNISFLIPSSFLLFGYAK